MKQRNLCSLIRYMLIIAMTSVWVAKAEAATISWDGGAGDGLWGSATNWSTDTVPLATDTASIGDTASNRTIYYNSGGTTTLAGLSLTQNTAGVTNMIHFIKGGTITINSDTTLGNGTATAVSKIYLDASLNQTAANGSNSELKIDGINDTLTITTGGVLEMAGYFNFVTAGNVYNPKITGNVVLSDDGKIITRAFLGTKGGIGNVITTQITGSFTMTGGTLNIYRDYDSNYTTGNRFRVDGNFKMSGGTITFDNSSCALQLEGVDNEITDGSISNSTGYIMLSKQSNGNQTFRSSIYIYDILARSYGDYTKTISSSYSGGTMQINRLQIAQSTASRSTTLKLASNLGVGSFFSSYGIGSTATVGYVVDLNGYTFSLTNGTSPQVWAPANPNGTTTGNWFITSTSSSTSYFEADSFNFSSANQVNVGYDVKYGETSSDPTMYGNESSGVVVLKATGTGANNLSSGGSINPTSKFWYANPTANTSATLTSTRTIGKLEVGDAAVKNTLRIVTNNLTVAGDVKVNSLSVLDLGGKVLTLTGAANLTGNGTYASTSSGGGILISGTGGLSPGGAVNNDSDHGIGSVGLMSFANSANMTGGVVLSSTSNSTFDIASTSSYDVLNLAGVAITYDGNLFINVISGTYSIGQTWELVLNEGSISGNFDTITSSNGWTFDFNEATGQLSLLAIPEPSTVVLLGLSGVLLLCALCRKARRLSNA